MVTPMSSRCHAPLFHFTSTGILGIEPGQGPAGLGLPGDFTTFYFGFTFEGGKSC